MDRGVAVFSQLTVHMATTESGRLFRSQAGALMAGISEFGIAEDDIARARHNERMRVEREDDREAAAGSTQGDKGGVEAHRVGGTGLYGALRQRGFSMITVPGRKDSWTRSKKR